MLTSRFRQLGLSQKMARQGLRQTGLCTVAYNLGIALEWKPNYDHTDVSGA